jgi:hypothetical protein
MGGHEASEAMTNFLAVDAGAAQPANRPAMMATTINAPSVRNNFMRILLQY